MKLSVYIPTEGSDLRDEIWPGSGIVGSEVGHTGRLRIDYEGDDDLYPRFRDRVRRAADRHLWEGPDGSRGYPTKACAYVDPDVLLEVGHWDVSEKNLELYREEPVAKWMDVDELPPSELTSAKG